jgi:hypothetical protein
MPVIAVACEAADLRAIPANDQAVAGALSALAIGRLSISGLLFNIERLNRALAVSTPASAWSGSRSDRAGRIAGDDGVGGHVLGDDGACGHHRAGADIAARQHDRAMADPDVMADSGNRCSTMQNPRPRLLALATFMALFIMGPVAAVAQTFPEYLPAQSFRDMQMQTHGEFGGLGIEVTMEDGLVKVVSPIDDTPASRAGVQANDIIVKLDEEQVQGLTLNQAVDKMHGPEGSKIKLTIMRKGQDKPVEITLTRARIRVRSVRSHIEGDDVGYIRISQFNEQTTEGVRKAISDFGNQGGDEFKGYIVDLRNNPGGLLDQAISVSDTFLEKGEIVSTRGRNAEEIQRFNAEPGDLTKLQNNAPAGFCEARV